MFPLLLCDIDNIDQDLIGWNVDRNSSYNDSSILFDVHASEDNDNNNTSLEYDDATTCLTSNYHNHERPIFAIIKSWKRRIGDEEISTVADTIHEDSIFDNEEISGINWEGEGQDTNEESAKSQMFEKIECNKNDSARKYLHLKDNDEIKESEEINEKESLDITKSDAPNLVAKQSCQLYGVNNSEIVDFATVVVNEYLQERFSEKAQST